MFKRWWFGNDLSTPFTGDEDYNRIEATIGDDPVNPLTFNRVFENLFSNTKDLYNFVSVLNKNQDISEGVFKNIGENFLVDINHIYETTDNIGTSYSIFIAPTGLYVKNGNLYCSSENYFLAIRQLCSALKIDPVSTEENVNLTWGVIQEADEGNNIAEVQGYICTIKKKNSVGVLETKTYKDTNALNLILRIAGRIINSNYGNDPNDTGYPYYITRYFVDSLGNFKPKFFKLRDMFDVENNVAYFFGIKDNKIILHTIVEASETFSDNPDDVLIAKISIINNAVTIEDNRKFSALCRGFDDKIFFNSNLTSDDTHDLSTVENPIKDNTLDYANIENKNSFITTLSKDSYSNNNNAVFGYISPDSSLDEVYEVSNPTDNGADSFFINKNIWIKTSDDLRGGYTQYTDLVQFINADRAFPAQEDFAHLPTHWLINDIESLPPVYLAQKENTFYSWIEASRDSLNVYLRWVPVENPYVQPNKLQGTHTVSGTAFTSIDFDIFKSWFSVGENALNLKEDGTNFYIFDKNGAYVPFYMETVTELISGEYVNKWHITLGIKNDPTPYSIPVGDFFFVSVIRGGEQYKAAYTILQSGANGGQTENNYSGSLNTFTIKNKVEALPDKVNVYVNGMLKNEAPIITTGTISSFNNLNKSIQFTATTLPQDGDYLYDVTIDKTFKIKMVNSSYYLESFDNSTFDDINYNGNNDAFRIYRKEIYDYFICTESNTIIFFDSLNTGDIVRIEDRVSIISNMDPNSSGSIFPENPLFGMEFWLDTTITEATANQYSANDEIDTFTEGWYKWNGNDWIKIS